MRGRLSPAGRRPIAARFSRVLLFSPLIWGAAIANQPPPSSLGPFGADDPGESTYAENAPPWLDEVRAQRQAWETRHDAEREAYEARRRLHQPPNNAHQDVWTDGIRRRHPSPRKRQEWERELHLNQGTGQFPSPWPWPSGPQLPTDGVLGAPPPPPSGDPLFVPPGWDNLWYFRGY